jgi:hypothetical protein
MRQRTEWVPWHGVGAGVSLVEIEAMMGQHKL